MKVSAEVFIQLFEKEEVNQMERTGKRTIKSGQLSYGERVNKSESSGLKRKP